MENPNRGVNFCISVSSHLTRKKIDDIKLRNINLRKLRGSLINTVIRRDRAEIFLVTEMYRKPPEMYKTHTQMYRDRHEARVSGISKS